MSKNNPSEHKTDFEKLRSSETTQTTLTFILGKSCNLNCKYCYVNFDNDNNSASDLTLDQAIRAVDLLLMKPESELTDRIVFEFIGGEPLVKKYFDNIIVPLVDYVHTKLEGHKWAEPDKHYFNFATNGINLDKPEIQEFLIKHKGCFEIGISMDGTREVQEMCREGSYDKIIPILPFYFSLRCKRKTKATISPMTIPYLFESHKHLVELGFNVISANLTFEEGWTDEHAEIFHDQMTKISAWYEEENLRDKGVECWILEQYRNMHQSAEPTTWCGSGKYMLAVAPDDLIYACSRFYLGNKKYSIGDWHTNGVEEEKLQLVIDSAKKWPDVCKDCPCNMNCSYCIASTYEKYGEHVGRDLTLCQMVKAGCSAMGNDIKWRE